MFELLGQDLAEMLHFVCPSANRHSILEAKLFEKMRRKMLLAHFLVSSSASYIQQVLKGGVEWHRLRC